MAPNLTEPSLELLGGFFGLLVSYRLRNRRLVSASVASWSKSPRDMRPIRDMTRTGEPFWAPARPSEVNVTMPWRDMLALTAEIAQDGMRSLNERAATDRP
jgi:hypothetical protein